MSEISSEVLRSATNGQFLDKPSNYQMFKTLTSFNLFFSGEGMNEHIFSPHHLPAATTPLHLFPLPPPSACSYISSPLIPPTPTICLQLQLLSTYSPYPPPSAYSYNSSPLIPPTPHYLSAATTPLHLFLPLPAIVNSSTICSAAGSLCTLL